MNEKKILSVSNFWLSYTKRTHQRNNNVSSSQCFSAHKITLGLLGENWWPVRPTRVTNVYWQIVSKNFCAHLHTFFIVMFFFSFWLEPWWNAAAAEILYMFIYWNECVMCALTCVDEAVAGKIKRVMDPIWRGFIEVEGGVIGCKTGRRCFCN